MIAFVASVVPWMTRRTAAGARTALIVTSGHRDALEMIAGEFATRLQRYAA